MDFISCDNNSEPFDEECINKTNNRNLTVEEESPDNIVASQCVDISTVDISNDSEITSVTQNIPLENTITFFGDKNHEKYVDTHNKENCKSTSDAVEAIHTFDLSSSNPNVGKVENGISSIKAEIHVSSTDDSVNSEISETEILESSEGSKLTNLIGKKVELSTNKTGIMSGSFSPRSSSNCERDTIFPSSVKTEKTANISNETIEESPILDLSSIKREDSVAAVEMNEIDLTKMSEKDSELRSPCSMIKNVKKSQNSICDDNVAVSKSSSLATDLPGNLASGLSSVSKPQLSQDVLKNNTSASGLEDVGNCKNYEIIKNVEKISGVHKEEQSEPVDIIKSEIEESLNSDSFPENISSEIKDVSVSSLSKLNVAGSEKFVIQKTDETSVDSTMLEIIGESNFVMKSQSLNRATVKCKSEKNRDSSTLEEKGQNDELGSKSVSDSNIPSVSLPIVTSQMSSNSSLNLENAVDSHCSDGLEKHETHNDISEKIQDAQSTIIPGSTTSQTTSEVSVVTEEMNHSLDTESGDNGTNVCLFQCENNDNNVLCVENVSEDVPNTSSTSNPSISVNSEVSKEVDENCISLQDLSQNPNISLSNEILDQSCCVVSLNNLKSPTSERSLIMSEIALKSVNENKEIALQCEGNSETNILTHDSITGKPCDTESPEKSVQPVKEKHPSSQMCSNHNTLGTNGDKSKSDDVSPAKSGASVRSVLLSEIALKTVSESGDVDVTVPFKMDSSNAEHTSPKKSCIIGSGFPRIVLREKSNKAKRGKKFKLIEKKENGKPSIEPTELLLNSEESEFVSEPISGSDCSVNENSISVETRDSVETNISPGRRNFLLKTAKVCLMKIEESVLMKYGLSLKDVSSADFKKNIDESDRKSSPCLLAEMKENSDVNVKQRANKRKFSKISEEGKQTVKYEPRMKKAKYSSTSKKQFTAGCGKKLPLKNVSRSKYKKNCIAVDKDKDKKGLNVTNDVSKRHVQEEINEHESPYVRSVPSKCNEFNIKRLQVHITKLDQNLLSEYGIHVNELKMTNKGRFEKVRIHNKLQPKRVRETKKEEKGITMNLAKTKHKCFDKKGSFLDDTCKEAVSLAGNEPSIDVDFKLSRKQSRMKGKRIVDNISENKNRLLGKNVNSFKETSERTILHVNNAEMGNKVFKLEDKETTTSVVVEDLKKVGKNRNTDLCIKETLDKSVSEQKGSVTNSGRKIVKGSVNRLRGGRRKLSRGIIENGGKCHGYVKVSQNNDDNVPEMKKDLSKILENFKSSEACMELEANGELSHNNSTKMAAVEKGSLETFDTNSQGSVKTSDTNESLRLENSLKPSAPLLQQNDSDVGIVVLDKCPTEDILLPKVSAFNLKDAVICLSKIDNNELLRRGISVDHLVSNSTKHPVGSKEVQASKKDVVHLKSILSKRSEHLLSSEGCLETRKQKRYVSFNITETVQECSESPPEKRFKPNLT